MSYTRYLTAELVIRQYLLMGLLTDKCEDVSEVADDPRITAFLDLPQRSDVNARAVVTTIMDAWDLVWERLGDVLQDWQDAVRLSGTRTNIPARDSSRHYECEEVGAELSGVWVGWTYWHGGGKHGEPRAIPWIEHAYLLDVTEEEKVVTVRTFRIKE